MPASRWSASGVTRPRRSVGTARVPARPWSTVDDVTETFEPPLPGAVVATAEARDAAEILVLQRCCWVEEAKAKDTLNIPALHESLEDVSEWGRLVAGVDRASRRKTGRGCAGTPGGRPLGDWPTDGSGLGRSRSRAVAAAARRATSTTRGDSARAVHRQQQRTQSPDVSVRGLRGQ